MATIDIRNDVVQDIDKIVFSEDCNELWRIRLG